MEEILTVDVALDSVLEVKGQKGEACMILFHGSSDCKNFKGKVLPGGVDTQKEMSGEKRLLSARYILEGTDCDGENCHIFIENNGTVEANGEITTTPVILTDSKALSWMENADLYGTVTGIEGGVKIAIYKK